MRAIFVLSLLLASCASTTKEMSKAECETSPALTDLVIARDAVKGSMAYPLGGGVSVDRVFEDLKDAAEKAQTPAEHLRVLEGFVYELGDHHAHLGTNDNVSPRLIPSGATAWVEARDGKMVVTEVRPDAPRPNQWLRAGMTIEGIDAPTMAESVRPPPSTPENAGAMLAFAARVALAGNRELVARARVRLDDGRIIDIPVPPMAERGDQPLASLKFARPDVALIRLNNSIGNTDLPAEFDRLMKQAKAAKTIIVDLRDTPSGGDSVVAKPLMAWFVKGTRGYQKHERGGRSWIEQVTGRSDAFQGRLIVLVDHWTGSMGEGTALGLRSAAGATLVGTPMAGLRGAIESFDLPCLKASLRLPVERLFTVDGTPREKAMPDVLVTEAELAAADADDAILDRALSLIL